MAVIEGGATTVKLTPLLETPLTVTTTLPVVALIGTLATRLVAVQVVTAGVPLNLTVLEPWVAPKFAPMMVTDVPIEADEGETVVSVGVPFTVKG